MLDIIFESFFKPFFLSYKFLDHYLIANFLTFVKGFEVGIVLTLVVIFLLISVGVVIRHARRLPKSYIIEIVDLDGKKVLVDGLRQSFSTYDAAESYARLYSRTYEHQYKFKVVGSPTSIISV